MRKLRLTEEFMENVGWRRCCLKEGMAGEEQTLAASFLRFMKQTHKMLWFSHASFEVVPGLCLETGVYWTHSLSEEEGKRMIRSKKGGGENQLFINVLELRGIVMTTYVMVVIRTDRPTKEGESVLRRGDSLSAVKWVINCGGGKGEERSGG